MKTQKNSDAIKACEEAIGEDRAYNLAHGIWPSQVNIADRFLARRLELKDAYDELYAQLGGRQNALRVFFDNLFGAAILWSPEKMRQARADKDELIEINQRIALLASDLTGLMKRRTELRNTSGFSCNTFYHLCDVIKTAGNHNHAFTNYVQGELNNLQVQYDLKYWPSPDSFVQALATDAEAATPEASDPVTAAATSGRSGKSDFFKALYANLRENSQRAFDPFPRNFELSDRTVATLANCALDLDAAELVDDAYVKRLRQRQSKVESRKSKVQKNSTSLQ